MYSYLTRRRGDSVLTSHDGRYCAVPHYRPAKRGPNPEVRDGWVLIDTWTGVERHYDTLSSVDRAIHGVRMDRDFARDNASRFVGWSAALSTPSGYAELRLHWRGGGGSVSAGLVSTKDPKRRWEGIQTVLADVGLADLPEAVRS